ncbi:MAG TPA: 2,3-diphosphoglycerate synthetase [Actinomycetota bacterium]|jgi:cyclic 2,3-diphosphoglycerate synthetase|nr:2,3-diphosphoglycerate synthetase [Actinomycetota bacterium]
MHRVLALVDGEHYPPTTRWGLFAAQSLGYDVVACLFLGGTEKLGADRRLDLGDVPVLDGGEDPRSALRRALEEVRPDGVLDLSDEPVLGYRERMLLAAVTLAAGIPYVGSDFRLEPPITAAPLAVPTLAVIGTGKRTGKTAIAGEAARVTARAGLDPVVVAMGRGGPPEPQVAEAGSLGLDRLLELARRGEHAASDYLEDAMTTGVTTVGARRVGGGLAGAPFASNVHEAAQVAVRAGAGLVILEGSGSAVPPVPWDAGVLVASAGSPEEYLGGYFGPYRVLLSDLVVLTLGSGPDGGRVPILISHIRRLRPDARVVVAELKPVPLREVRGKKVYFATTAPPDVGASVASHLEEAHGCQVVGVTHRLADRNGVGEDLDGAPSFEILLTELKAAAVDVAAERALARGAEVVFADNRAETLGGDGQLPDLLLEAARAAMERAESEGRDRRIAGSS